jgi:hypothetical protein
MDNQVMSNGQILQPQIQWMGKRSFRVVGDCKPGAGKPQMIESEESFEMNEEYDDLGDANSSLWNIEMIREGLFEAKLPVPRYVKCQAYKYYIDTYICKIIDCIFF